MIRGLAVFGAVLVFTMAALCGLGLLVASCTSNHAKPGGGLSQVSLIAAVDAEGASLPDCSKPSPSCEYSKTHKWSDDVTHRKAGYLCAAWLAACGPKPIPVDPPPPVPSETGGTAGVGGASSTGGAGATGGKTAAGGGISTGGTTAQTTDALACQKLHALGCPEAADPAQCANPDDPTSMAARCKNPKVKCNPACIIAAVSKADVQSKCHIACGGL
jgi:hypothetical protein